MRKRKAGTRCRAQSCAAWRVPRPFFAFAVRKKWRVDAPIDAPLRWERLWASAERPAGASVWGKSRVGFPREAALRAGLEPTRGLQPRCASVLGRKGALKRDPPGRRATLPAAWRPLPAPSLLPPGGALRACQKQNPGLRGSKSAATFSFAALRKSLADFALAHHSPQAFPSFFRCAQKRGTPRLGPRYLRVLLLASASGRCAPYLVSSFVLDPSHVALSFSFAFGSGKLGLRLRARRGAQLLLRAPARFSSKISPSPRSAVALLQHGPWGALALSAPAWSLRSQAASASASSQFLTLLGRLGAARRRAAAPRRPRCARPLACTHARIRKISFQEIQRLRRGPHRADIFPHGCRSTSLAKSLLA